MEFIIEQLKIICQKDQFFVNLRGDIFMVVTEYDKEEDLVDFIRQIDSRIRCFKEVNLRLSYGVYSASDKTMELRQMEDRATMARRAAKKNILTNILFL